MFANSFQSGFISVFYSVGSNPLSLWDKSVKNGHIRRVVDDEVKSLVLELSGTNVATTYITCPIKARASLGIKLPFLVMVVKNMKKYFTFEIQIADDKDMRRRFRVSNFQSTTKVRPFCTTMPIGLSPGWNQIQFNLADFTRRAYGSTYLETVRVQIHANVRIRRIYFSDRLYADDEMPHEFKLFLPIPGTHRRQQDQPRKTSKEPEKKPSKEAVEQRASVDKVQLIEQEIPSAAPPATPVEESPRGEDEEEAAPPAEPEAQPEEEAPPSEAPAEGEAPPAEEGEAAAEGAEAPPAEGEEAAPSEAPVEGEEAPAAAEGEEAAAEEAPPEEAPAEEGVPAAEEGAAEEAAPAEGEGEAEAPPAEEAAAEEPPAE